MSSRRTRDTDDGFGLIEVVVAMLLFAVIAMAMLPLVEQATRLSAGNRDAVSANAVASAELAAIRAKYPDGDPNACSIVDDVTPSTDAFEVTIRVVCPTSYPGVATVVVSVAPDEASAELVEMATQIVVTQ